MILLVCPGMTMGYNYGGTGGFNVNQKWPFSGLKWIFFGFSKSGWVRT